MEMDCSSSTVAAITERPAALLGAALLTLAMLVSSLGKVEPARAASVPGAPVIITLQFGDGVASISFLPPALQPGTRRDLLGRGVGKSRGPATPAGSVLGVLVCKTSV